MRKSFIYSLTILNSGWSYVGASVEPAKRFAAHKAKAAAGRHNNKYVQEAVAEAGTADALFMTLLEVCDVADSVEREAFWILEMLKFGRVVNMQAATRLNALERLAPTPVRKGLQDQFKRRAGRNLTPLESQRMRAARKPVPQERRDALAILAKKRTKPVYNLTTGKKYLSAQSAAVAYQCSPMSIAQACRGKTKTSRGQQWSYDPQTPLRDIASPWTEERRRKAGQSMGERAARQVRCIETQTIFASITEAARSINRNAGTLCNAIRSARPCANFTFEYVEETHAFRRTANLLRPVYNLTTGEIFENRNEAAISYECSTSSVAAACKGHLKMLKGCQWSYDKNAKPKKIESAWTAEHREAAAKRAQKRASKPIKNITTNETFPSVKAAARAINRTAAFLSECMCSGRKCAGFEWTYHF